MTDRDFKDSIETYNKALEIYESLNDLQGKAIAHLHLGSVYLAAAADYPFEGIPSVPPTEGIPSITPPLPKPRPRPPKGPKGLESIRKSIENFSQAVELSQAEEDLATQAFSLLKLGEAQVMQSVEIAAETTH